MKALRKRIEPLADIETAFNPAIKPKGERNMIKVFLTALIISAVSTTPVFANDETQINERARLENALSELDLIREFVNQTQSTPKRNRRSRFNYKVFDDDIETLKAGIRAYLNHNSTRPLKQTVPLNAPSGEYRT